MSTVRVQVKPIMDIKEWSQTLYDSVLLKIPKYQRPVEWLAFPTLVVGQQKFVGLHAVYNTDSNFVALTAAGNYTVDWGDGVVQNFAANVTAQHTFNYNDFGAQTPYNDYRQSIVTITPQAGQTLTVIDIQKESTVVGISDYRGQWLDIKIVGPNISTLSIGGTNVRNQLLQTFEFIGTNLIVDLSYKFQHLAQLHTVIGLYTGAVTNFSGAFQNCTSLQSIPLLNTAAGTNFSNMFLSCFSLWTIPTINTGLGVNFNGMFQNCYSMPVAPLLDTGSGTDFGSMFYACYSLPTIPPINTSKGTLFTYMFAKCYSLKTIPLIDTAKGVNMTYMFSECMALSTIPLLNTALCTNFQNTFYNALALTTIPPLNTVAGTNFVSMFQGCSLLEKVPLLNTQSGTNLSNMFNGCSALHETPAFNLTAATSLSSFFLSALSLKVCRVENVKASFDVSGCMLSAGALETMFTNSLGYITTVKSVNISTNWGAPALISKSTITSTANSITVPVAATTGLTVGMEVYGAFITANRTITLTTGTNLLTFTSHQLPADQKVSFTTSVAGIILNTVYYVINPTANTFQISLTQGGAAVTISASTTILMRAYPKIVTVNTNVSVVLDIPAAASGSNTMTAQLLKRSIALLKGWTVIG